MMERDIRGDRLYRAAQDLCGALRRPGTGQISDATDVHCSADGMHAVFAGIIVDRLEGSPPSRICLTDLARGETRVLTFGPGIDRFPKFSPDGRQIAFLSDRHRAGDFQLYLLALLSGAARATPRVDGWVEYLQWSPDGRRILLASAGHGADVSGGQGAITSKQSAQALPSWAPAVETGEEAFRWRRAWVYDLASGISRQVSPPDSNIWEAVWCGNEALAAVVSPGPGEGLWYMARLQLLQIGGDGGSDKRREIYTPQDQLGWVAGSPSGRHLAVVEATCSDRWVVAGDLKLIDVGTGKMRPVDTGGVDVTHTEWRSDRKLLVAGHRAFEIAVGLVDSESGAFNEVWRSREVSNGGRLRYVAVSGYGEAGECVLAGESFTRAPEIGVIRRGEYAPVRSFDLGYAQAAQAIRTVKEVTWRAPDGLEMQGWLLQPGGRGPYPLVMCVHGGPVGQWHPMWLGRPRHTPYLMLVQRGYAVFFPNPRGSGGRGQDFARRVVGDMGGADTYDYLSGLDYLVQEGIADPKRLGVTGVSYGGFMTSWLITQDARFAAAVPIAPSTNQVTQHLISNIPDFVALFLKGRYTNPTGKYFERSPVMHAHKAKTPTLSICGALDRCTPPEEAVQFHHALLENGVKSVLVTYPEEGHGIHHYPAAIDFAARLVGWFEEHMPASDRSQS